MNSRTSCNWSAWRTKESRKIFNPVEKLEKTYKNFSMRDRKKYTSNSYHFTESGDNLRNDRKKTVCSTEDLRHASIKPITAWAPLVALNHQRSRENDSFLSSRFSGPSQSKKNLAVPPEANSSGIKQKIRDERKEPETVSGLILRKGLIRFPKGPDGTKGFYKDARGEIDSNFGDKDENVPASQKVEKIIRQNTKSSLSPRARSSSAKNRCTGKTEDSQHRNKSEDRLSSKRNISIPKEAEQFIEDFIPKIEIIDKKNFIKNQEMRSLLQLKEHQQKVEIHESKYEDDRRLENYNGGEDSGLWIDETGLYDLSDCLSNASNSDDSLILTF